MVGVSAGAPGIEARLQRENGLLHLRDETYGDGRPPLFSFPADEPGLAETVLGHYARYRQTLRIPLRRRSLLEGVLKVKLLGSPERQISPKELQAPSFDELPSDSPWRYKVQEGDGFVVQVENHAQDPLDVFIFNCAGSGRVEYLGGAQIPASSLYVLWSDQQLGTPFYPTVATKRKEIVERLIMIGATLQNQDLRYLRVDESFAEVIQRYRDAKDMGGVRAVPTSLVEKWTVELITLRIYK